MSNSFSDSILPKARPSDPANSGILYARITFNGKRAEFSTSRKIDLRFWNSRMAKPKEIQKGLNPFDRFINP